MYTSEFLGDEDNMLRFVANVDNTTLEGLRIGASALVEVAKYGWANLSYSTFYGAGVGVGANIAERFSIGYTIEQGLGNFTDFGLSHEISIAYNFAPRESTRTGRRSPRTLNAEEKELIEARAKAALEQRNQRTEAQKEQAAARLEKRNQLIKDQQERINQQEEDKKRAVNELNAKSLEERDAQEENTCTGRIKTNPANTRRRESSRRETDF